MEQAEKNNGGVSSDEKAAKESTGDGKKKHKKGLVFFILSGLAAVVILIYGGIAIYYQSHFWPGVWINDVNCSNLNLMSAAALVEAQAEGYSLEVTGRDWTEKAEEGQGENIVLLGTLEAGDIQLKLTNVQEGLQAILSQQNVFLWPKALLRAENHYDMFTGKSCDEELLEKLVKNWDAFQAKNMTAPKDAYIGEYNGRDYVIVSDTKGTKLDVPAALEHIKTAVLAGASGVNLDELGCYQTASVTSDDKELQKVLGTLNKWLQTEITYDWNGNEVRLDREQIHEWISMEEGKPKLNEEAAAEFVAASAKKFDTYGKKRKFTTSMGVELTLPSGAYGWKTDRAAETEELLSLINRGSVLEREPVYTMKAAAKGEDDIGSSYVEIDLSNQHLYLYDKGELKLESDFVSGDMSRAGRMTPPGVFGLTYKTKDAVLRGQDYETPVKYWMPFNGNIGMHDASWRRNFGGDIYLTNGSHGCINLPRSNAEMIYAYVSTGFPVICYYY